MAEIPLERFPVVFQAKVRARLTSDHLNDLLMLPSGLALLRQGDTFVPLGCPFCLDVPRAQDPDGYPYVGGRKAIRADEHESARHGVPPEVAANTWLCPGCRIPLIDLMPRFDNGE